MLLTRVLTALVLLPLVLAGIYLLPTIHFAWITAAIFALGAYEWAQLTLGPNNGLRWPFYVAYSAICALLWSFEQAALVWLGLAGLGWLWAIWEVLRIRALPEADDRIRPHWVLLGLIMLPGAWVGLLQLRDPQPHLLIAVCLIVWGADVGAYFVGRSFGRRKLAPFVSPGKTWEGALGGCVIGTVVALGFAVATGVWSLNLLLVPALVALTNLSLWQPLARTQQVQFAIWNKCLDRLS